MLGFLNLFESMDVSVTDAPYNWGQSGETLGDIYHYVNSKVGQELMRKWPNWNEFIDGGSYLDGMGIDYFAETGDLYVTVPHGMPEEMEQLVLKATVFYIGDLDCVVGDPVKRPATERFKHMFKHEWVVPVTENNYAPPENPPPEVNLSNRNAYHIFCEVLNFNAEWDNGMAVSVSDLLTRIGTASFNAHTKTIDPSQSGGEGSATVIDAGLDGQGIEQRLQAIQNVCEWAVENGYSQIQIF